MLTDREICPDCGDTIHAAGRCVCHPQRRMSSGLRAIVAELQCPVCHGEREIPDPAHQVGDGLEGYLFAGPPRWIDCPECCP